MKHEKKHFSIKRILRFLYLKIVRMNDSAPRVALGVAIGVFLGIFPTPFIGPVLAFFFAWLVGANKVAAVLGGIIMNPFTTPFFWTASAYLGALITGTNSAELFNLIKSGEIFKASLEFIFTYLAGNTIIAAVFSTISYYFTLYILKTHKERAFKTHI